MLKTFEWCCNQQILHLFLDNSLKLLVKQLLFSLGLTLINTLRSHAANLQENTQGEALSVYSAIALYFLLFNLFKLNELWPYYQKHVYQIVLNSITLRSLGLWIFEVFIRILLIVNLSLNETLLKFLLCGRQTWMTQLILEISLWEVIFL